MKATGYGWHYLRAMRRSSGYLGIGNENPVNQIEVQADTPEDAAALLAIALFKRGILP